MAFSAFFRRRQPRGRAGLYEITCPAAASLVYIGSAVDIDRRWAQHRADLTAGRHANGRLQALADQYGVDSLECRTVHEMTRTRRGELTAAEAIAIEMARQSGRDVLNLAIPSSNAAAMQQVAPAVLVSSQTSQAPAAGAPPRPTGRLVRAAAPDPARPAGRHGAGGRRFSRLASLAIIVAAVLAGWWVFAGDGLAVLLAPAAWAVRRTGQATAPSIPPSPALPLPEVATRLDGRPLPAPSGDWLGWTADGRWQAVVTALAAAACLAALIAVLWLVVLVARWALPVWDRWLSRHHVRPDSDGLLPIELDSRRPGADPFYVRVSTEALGAVHGQRMAAAARPNVPQEITVVERKADVAALAALPPPDPLAALPATLSLPEALSRSDMQRGSIVLGVDGAGAMVVVPAADWHHFMAIGRPQSGKTTTTRAYVLQLCRLGARLVMIDFKFNRPAWRPFEPWMLRPPAVTAPDGLDTLRAVATELRSRKRVYQEHGREAMSRFRHLLVWMDEVPGWKDAPIGRDGQPMEEKVAAPIVAEVYRIVKFVLRQGAELRVTFIMLSQDGQVGTTGLSTGLLSTYGVVVAAGKVDETSAARFLDGAGAPVDRLGKGVAVAVVGGRSALVRTPLATNEQIAEMLADPPDDDGQIMATDVSEGDQSTGGAPPVSALGRESGHPIHSAQTTSDRPSDHPVTFAPDNPETEEADTADSGHSPLTADQIQEVIDSLSDGEGETAIAFALAGYRRGRPYRRLLAAVRSIADAHSQEAQA